MKFPIFPPVLMAAVLAIPSAALADRGPPAPRFRDLPPAPISNLAPTAQGRLEAAQHSLTDALAALNRANGSQGPLLDSAIAEIKAAGTLVNGALNYVKAHPDSNELAPGPSGDDQHRLASVPSGTQVPGVNLLAAMEALNTALGQFLNTAKSKSVVLGELGGSRTAIEDALSRASSDVLAVIRADSAAAATAARANAVARAAARASGPPVSAPPLAQPKATAAAVLIIVPAIFTNTGFVGPNSAGAHFGMYSDLTALQRAANIVAKDDGSDAALSLRNNSILSRDLEAAISRAATISGSPDESDESKAASVQLHTQLLQTKNPDGTK